MNLNIGDTTAHNANRWNNESDEEKEYIKIEYEYVGIVCEKNYWCDYKCSSEPFEYKCACVCVCSWVRATSMWHDVSYVLMSLLLNKYS